MHLLSTRTRAHGHIVRDKNSLFYLVAHLHVAMVTVRPIDLINRVCRTQQII